jgi:hypothetical protein
MPVIIKGAAKGWPGYNNWQFQKLIERFGNSLFKIAEDD